MITVLVDTNILLDHLQQRSPQSNAAGALWRKIEDRELTGCVSAISFNNVFYVVRKQAGNERALELVQEIRRVFRTVPLDDQVIDAAIQARQTDFEDAIQAASAIAAGAQYIISRDTKGFAGAGVPVVDAEGLLLMLLP
jgi:predicted nucleic acid-binding protein